MSREQQPQALAIRPFAPADEAAVVDLWRCCDLLRPQNNPGQDIRRKAKVRPDLFLVGVLDGRIVASVMIGYEGHRGWINYLAVAPGHRRKGFGRRLMEAAERLLEAEGCPKLNLQVRRGNEAVLQFYRALGYVADDVVSLGKRLVHDAPPSATQ